MFIRTASSLLIILGCLACTPPSKFTAQASGQSTHDTQAEPEIGFFTFSIYKQGNTNQVTLSGKKTTKGTIKDITPYVKNPSATLTADFYDGDAKVKSVTIDHPLHQGLEVVKEDKTTMEPVNVHKDSSSFFLRIQLDKKITAIKFTETLDQKQKTLNTIKL